MRVTIKTIQNELQRRGEDVHLEKGDGYFYFRGKEPDNWLDKTVRVATLSSLTLEQWVAEYERLKNMNRDLLRGPAPASAHPESKARSRQRKRKE